MDSLRHLDLAEATEALRGRRIESCLFLSFGDEDIRALVLTLDNGQTVRVDAVWLNTSDAILGVRLIPEAAPTP